MYLIMGCKGQLGTELSKLLPDAIVKIIQQMTSENSGIYHFTNEGVWYQYKTLERWFKKMYI